MKIVSDIKESVKAAYRKVMDKFKKIRERRKQITQERIAEYERNEQKYQEFRKNKAAKRFERKEAKRNKQEMHTPQGRQPLHKRDFHIAEDFEEYETDDRVLRKPFINDRLKNYGRVEDELLQRDNYKTGQSDNEITPTKDNQKTAQTNITIIINGEKISSVDINSGNQNGTSAKPGGTSAKPANPTNQKEVPAKPVISSNEVNASSNRVNHKDDVNKSHNSNPAKQNEASAKPVNPTKPINSAKPGANKPKSESTEQDGFFNAFEVKPLNLFGDEKDEG